MTALKPPTNRRTVVPHICATCRYMKFIGKEGVIECQRDGYVMDTGDRDDIVTTCDGWRNGTGLRTQRKEVQG